MSDSIGRSARARFSGVQFSCRNSGIDVLADHEIGQNYRRHPDRTTQDQGLHAARRDRPSPSAHPHSASSSVTVPDLARAARAIRNAARFSFSPITICGGTSQLLTAFTHRRLEMRHGRQHRLEGCALAAELRRAPGRIPPDDAGSRCAGCPAAPAEPAVSASRRFRSSALGRSEASCSVKGMADIAAGRPAQLAVFLRLERQQRQHVIDIAHASRARGPAATPRPIGDT